MLIKFNGIVCFVVAASLVGCSVIGLKNGTLVEQPHTYHETFVPERVSVTSPGVSGSNVSARTVDMSHNVDMYVADWRLTKRS
jgi:hypothetical protein